MIPAFTGNESVPDARSAMNCSAPAGISALIWPMKVFYAAIWLQTTMLTLYLARSVVRMIQTGSIKNEEAGVKGGEAL